VSGVFLLTFCFAHDNTQNDIYILTDDTVEQYFSTSVLQNIVTGYARKRGTNARMFEIPKTPTYSSKKRKRWIM